MSARFLAVGSFLLRARNLFVIVGDVVEGEVREGMRLALPLNGSVSVTGVVSSVEFVDILHEKRSYVGLAIAYEDSQELGFWQAMAISGETLSLESPPTLESQE